MPGASLTTTVNSISCLFFIRTLQRLCKALNVGDITMEALAVNGPWSAYSDGQPSPLPHLTRAAVRAQLGRRLCLADAYVSLGKIEVEQRRTAAAGTALPPISSHLLPSPSRRISLRNESLLTVIADTLWS